MKKRLALVIAIVLVLATAATLFAACQKEKYDLSYASWNLGTEALNNIERQMVKAFEEKFNVKVRIEENIAQGGAYDDSIRSLAIKKNLPDVFMISNMDFALREGSVTDITDLVNADTTGDWQKIPAAIEEAVHFKSGIYAIPFAMHMQGYFVNVDLLKEANQESFLTQEFNYQNFENVVKALKNFQGSSGTCIGLNSEESMVQWYASSQNENYGFFTWDGSNYHLNSSEFTTGMQKVKELREGRYTYDSLTEADRQELFEGVDGDVKAWDQGRIAFRWGNTYEAPDMVEHSGDFEKRFIGIPGGRTVIVGDYVSVSNTCPNKQLAYEFAKWMSFSPDGIRKRIELNSSTPNTLPLTTDMTLVNEFFDKFDNLEGENAVLGIKDMYDNLDKGIVECVKVVPGYNKARWTANTGVTATVDEAGTQKTVNVGELLDACRNGYETYLDYAAQLNTLVNEQYANAIKQYESKYE